MRTPRGHGYVSKRHCLIFVFVESFINEKSLLDRKAFNKCIQIATSTCDEKCKDIIGLYIKTYSHANKCAYKTFKDKDTSNKFASKVCQYENGRFRIELCCAKTLKKHET